MSETTQPATVSPDGMWKWDGTQWVPNANGADGVVGAPSPVAPKKRSGLRILGIGAGILAGLIVVGAAFGDADDTTSSSDSSSSSVSGGAASDEVAAESESGIGDEVRDGKFAFTVVDVERGANTYGDGFLAEEAQGEFTIVTVRVENIGDEAQMFTASDLEGIDSKDRTLSAEAGFGDSFLEDINPGNSVTAEVAFDVAKGESLASIVVHDSMFSDGAPISLS